MTAKKTGGVTRRRVVQTAAAGAAAATMVSAPALEAHARAADVRPQWSTALPDWSTRIVAGDSLIPPGLPINRDRADKALRIFKRLKMTDVLGQPTFGQACRQWVFDFVEVIFGCFDPVAKQQLIRQFMLLISKKNGKSTIAAGIMLTALIMNQRAQGEYMILAPTKEIADNSFVPAAAMVAADKALKAKFKVSDAERFIEDRVTGAVLQVKSADANVVGGGKSIAVFIDELWLFGKMANAEKIFSEALGGQVSRPEGFVIYATTQSDDPPAGVFKTKLDYFRGIRDGLITDPQSLAVTYEYPQDMQKAQAWRNSSTWAIPNPNLGASVDPMWLTTKLGEKQNEGLQAVTLFVAKHFNAEVGMGIRADRWAGAEFWEASTDKTITLQTLKERCEAIVVGLDGGGLDDLYGVSFLGRCKETKAWLAWNIAFAHESVWERRKTIASVLDDAVKAGELIKVKGKDLNDIAQIVSWIAEVKDAGLLAGVAVDPEGIGEMVDALAAPDVDVTQENGLLIGVVQGYRLMNAIKTAERKLVGQTLRHNGSALAAWCVTNLKIEPTATAIRATKQNAGDAKIDIAMALFDAVYWMSTNPQAKPNADYQMFVLA